MSLLLQDAVLVYHAYYDIVEPIFYYVCVSERAREREDRERDKERKRVCVCACVVFSRNLYCLGSFYPMV